MMKQNKVMVAQYRHTGVTHVFLNSICLSKVLAVEVNTEAPEEHLPEVRFTLGLDSFTIIDATELEDKRPSPFREILDYHRDMAALCPESELHARAVELLRSLFSEKDLE